MLFSGRRISALTLAVATFALIHGGGGSAWDWHLVAPALHERGHDAVAVDLPIDDESAGWKEYTDAVVQAVGSLRGVVVVGHSLTSGSTGSAQAFIWTAKCGMLDLQTVLQHQGARIPNGWILQIATDISEDGTVITGYGISPPVQGSQFGQTEPWRAVLPTPC